MNINIAKVKFPATRHTKKASNVPIERFPLSFHNFI